MSEPSSDIHLLNCHEILEVLGEQEGNIVTVTFPSPQEAETFRVKLYQTKKRSEQTMVDIGFITEEEILTLSIKKTIVGGLTSLKLMLTQKIEPMKYAVVVERAAAK